MNYGTVKKNDIANGPGIRVSLFVSGCRHHCKNCFNPETWNFLYGEHCTGKTVTEILEELHKDHVAGLSVLGGEPMEPENQESLVQVLRDIKSAYPDKSIWCWTGYLYEDLLEGGKNNTIYTHDLLSYIDVLVDGAFIEELKDIRLKFRGSSNQRIIDIKKSREQNSVVIYDI